MLDFLDDLFILDLLVFHLVLLLVDFEPQALFGLYLGLDLSLILLDLFLQGRCQPGRLFDLFVQILYFLFELFFFVGEG